MNMSTKVKGFLLMCIIVVVVLCVTTVWNYKPPAVKGVLPMRDDEESMAMPRYWATPLKKTREKGRKGDRETDELLQILKTRLERYEGPQRNWTRVKCSKGDGRSKVCFDADCPAQFSPSLRERLKQVLSSRRPLPAKHLQALASAAESVTSHKYIFVTAASSDHFKEMQALIYTMFSSLFPRLEGEDYHLVIYNLGLTEEEKRLTQKNCRCTVLDFPFSALPDFIQQLKCYVWKPLVVASLLEKAEYLTWADASIRFQNSDPIQEMFQKARENGYQTRANHGSIAVRSRASMADFFGDHLCQYSSFSEMETNFMIFYNDRFTREAIMKPWLACAFDFNCMCTPNNTDYLYCGPGPNRRIYERCHRFEQSSIGMIFSKLYLGSRPMLHVPFNTVKIARRTEMDWFKP